MIGILPAGGSAAIVGRTAAGDWWQLQGANIQGGQGWAPADRVQAQNAGAVPVDTLGAGVFVASAQPLNQVAFVAARHSGRHIRRKQINRHAPDYSSD